MRICRESSFRGQNYTAEAKAALRCAFVDKGLLKRMRPFRRAQAVERSDLIFADSTDWCYAGTHHLPANENAASATLRQPTTEFRPPQAEFIREHKQERRCRIDIY